MPDNVIINRSEIQGEIKLHKFIASKYTKNSRNQKFVISIMFRIISIIIFFSELSFGQIIQVSFGKSMPDTDLEYLKTINPFIYENNINAPRNKSFDSHFFANCLFNILDRNIFSFNTGIGVGMSRQRFGHLVNKDFFSKVGEWQTAETKWVKRYDKYFLTIPFNFDIALHKTEKTKGAIRVNFNNYFLINRKVNADPNYLTFRYFSFDINLGYIFKFKNISFGPAYRFINFEQKDNALYNSITHENSKNRLRFNFIIEYNL